MQSRLWWFQREEAHEDEVSSFNAIPDVATTSHLPDSEVSVSESLISDEGNFSTLSATTSDTSFVTDSQTEVAVTTSEECFTENKSEVIDSKVEEAPLDVQEPISEEIPLKDAEATTEPPQIDESCAQTADTEVNNLEQQLSDIVLGQSDQNDVALKEELIESAPQDVEMSEAAPEMILPPREIPAEETKPEIEDIKIESSSLIENPIDLMDFEDNSRFVRRSRRLQTPVIETPIAAAPEMVPPVEPEVKPEPIAEDPAPVPPPAEIKLEEPVEPKPEPEVPVKAPEIRKRVEHTDERLKRYETIRDNIFVKKADKKVCKANKTMKCDCTITEEEVKNGEMGCQYNCINRLLYIECGPKCYCGEYCDNQQFQRYNYSNCSVFDTVVKGFGIRADQDIAAETFIIEYVGEVLDNKQFEKRAKKYSENKNVHYYFMALKSNAIIDATKKGNISRFINHSCDPNAETQKWTVNGELRVGFFSKKDIKAGEEITFDYQYQRYGKEAQQCFCEAPNCRGWIGENPENIEEEDENAESAELDDSKVKKTKAKKGRKPKALEVELKDESPSENESENKSPVKKREPAKKLLALKMKKRQERFDDLEIEGEINDLTASGLKNRAHTIRLSRLVVRAKNVEARSRLLKILVNGDMPCCRLFLDYNGLKLLHQWMVDLNVKSSIPELGLAIEMTKTLDVLPIINKTVLRTSKVLDRVEKWKNLDLDKKKVTKDLEKKKLTKEERRQAKLDKKKNKEAEKRAGSISEDQSKPENAEEVSGAPAVESMDTSQPPEESEEEVQLMNLKLELKRNASELLEKWEALQEDFKIPKKQKQEIMIEHEREVDDWDDGGATVPLSNDRYKSRFGEDSAQTAANRAAAAPYRKPFDPLVSKQQRRQMFEMQIAQKDTEKRMSMLHYSNCAIFGLNSNTTYPIDVPVRVNRVTGEYITIDGRTVPPPPNHYQFKYEPYLLSTNPEDYHLPPMDLPDHWRFAINEFGRIYYYHEKIRISQWEPPIKILPLKPSVESLEDSPDSDESTTDTEDSEEEELRELLEMLKRKKYLPPVQTSANNPLILSNADGDEDDLEKKIMNSMQFDTPLKLQAMQGKMKKKKRHGLTSVQFIRPRTEADKIYGRAESKRYKEVKEALRQKKRRILKGESQPNDGSSDDDDDVAIDVAFESRRCVDELDILEQSELERNKTRKEIEKRLKKPKPVVQDPAEIKRQFRDDIKREIAKYLQPYRDGTCDNGKITNDIDFNSLVNKVRRFLIGVLQIN